MTAKTTGGENVPGREARGAQAQFRAYIADFNVQITIEAGATEGDVDAMLTATGHALRKLREKGCPPAYGFVGPNGHVSAQSAPPPAAGPQVLATGHATGSDGPTGGQIGVASYIVKPEAGGKRRVEFWNPAREYPEIQAVKTPEQLTALMGDLPADADEYVIPVVVTWVRGKAKASGNGHYQDIVRVHRAA